MSVNTLSQLIYNLNSIHGGIYWWYNWLNQLEHYHQVSEGWSGSHIWGVIGQINWQTLLSSYDSVQNIHMPLECVFFVMEHRHKITMITLHTKILVLKRKTWMKSEFSDSFHEPTDFLIFGSFETVSSRDNDKTIFAFTWAEVFGS